MIIDAPPSAAQPPQDGAWSQKLSLKRFSAVLAGLALFACATPAQMHSEAQLNDVALGCGLSLGELIQDDSEHKLLLTVHQDTTPLQRVCVARWARRNGLKAVFVNMQFPEGPKT